jgi:hypothetical protein
VSAVVKAVTTIEFVERNTIKQFDAFPVIPFSANIPAEMLKLQALNLEMITMGTPTIIQDVQKLKENSLEIEQ